MNELGISSHMKSAGDSFAPTTRENTVLRWALVKSSLVPIVETYPRIPRVNPFQPVPRIVIQLAQEVQTCERLASFREPSTCCITSQPMTRFDLPRLRFAIASILTLLSMNRNIKARALQLSVEIKLKRMS